MCIRWRIYPNSPCLTTTKNMYGLGTRYSEVACLLIEKHLNLRQRDPASGRGLTEELHMHLDVLASLFERIANRMCRHQPRPPRVTRHFCPYQQADRDRDAFYRQLFHTLIAWLLRFLFRCWLSGLSRLRRGCAGGYWFEVRKECASSFLHYLQNACIYKNSIVFPFDAAAYRHLRILQFPVETSRVTIIVSTCAAPPRACAILEDKKKN